MSDSEYQKSEDGSKVNFEVKPASCPKNKIALYGMVAPLMLITSPALFAGVTIAIIWIAVFGGFVYLGAIKDWRPAAHRVPASFSVSPIEIQSNGRVFKKDDIHRLIIKNGVSKNEVNISVIVPGGRGQLAGMASRRYKQKISEVAHSLDLESGGKAYTLAGGMSETTAFGLMTDVSKILGLQVS